MHKKFFFYNLINDLNIEKKRETLKPFWLQINCNISITIEYTIHTYIHTYSTIAISLIMRLSKKKNTLIFKQTHMIKQFLKPL